MSAATVRAAVAAFLSTPPITNLNQCWTAMPVRINASDYITPNSSPAQGAVGWVWVEHQTERVISAPAPGWRMVDYQVAVVLKYRVVNPKQTDLSYQDAVETLCEAIKQRIRSDPTLGTSGGPNPIFTAGNEFPKTEAPSITVLMGEPRQNKSANGINVDAAVVFPVTEQVAS